jgi:hypothetical protein
MLAMAFMSVATMATRFSMVVFFLLNGHVCQIVKVRSHLLCLVEFGSLIHTKCCVASSHAIDIVHLSKGSSPMGLPVGPSVVDDRATFLLAPGQRHVAAP